ncbi:MAG: DUF192 domain-containing protein [Pseudomonadota bacterium]
MRIISLISVSFIVITLFFLFSLFDKKENLLLLTKNNMTLYLEIANTQKQREYGLMNRKSMPENHGMIFIFPHAEILRFWMKNTLIPLDMIFLNHHRVVAIFFNIPPCKEQMNPCPSYGPNIQADEVIELNAGVAKKLTIINGDILPT